jgi:hypothetical protein
MSLSYRENRLLRRIDHALCRSDPDLALRLSVFTRINEKETTPDREQLRTPRAWVWRMLWPVASAAFLLVLRQLGVQPPHTARPRPLALSSFAGCQPPTVGHLSDAGGQHCPPAGPFSW